MNVRVRMYRQGLGDCFLVTFDPGGEERHVLIDCGTLGATTTGVKMADVVKDIRTTAGNHLHLVVGTHEHQDHLSGFRDQKALFAQTPVDHVWLAWTENPKDTLAQQIVKFQGDLVSAIAAAAAALGAGADEASQDAGAAIADLLTFMGGDVSNPLAFAPTVHQAMEIVRTELGSTVTYLKPSKKPIEPAWLPGFRFYVLGPPRSVAALADLGEHGSSELYGVAAGLRAAAAMHASGTPVATYAAALDARARGSFERELPFDLRCRIEADDELVQAAYGATYFAERERWRRVDHDWLHVASDLALQLDSLTNNTSLALAIERIADGKVLLFPADAQQGHWLSWHAPARKWTVKDADGTPRQVTAADLLSRTVFYKVGHHGSHNATAKDKGLELMTREQELVAFIPVDRDVALGRHPKKSWQMPARALYRRLLQKCEGRVVRSDLGLAAEAAAGNEVEQEFENLASAAEWAAWKQAQQAAAGRIKPSSLFVDFFLD